MNFNLTGLDDSLADFIEGIINRAIVDADITVEVIEARLCFLETEEMRLLREAYRAKRSGQDKPAKMDDTLCYQDVEAMRRHERRPTGRMDGKIGTMLVWRGNCRRGIVWTWRSSGGYAGIVCFVS